MTRRRSQVLPGSTIPRGSPAPSPPSWSQNSPVDFNVWTVSYLPFQTACFADVARSLVRSLRELGYTVEESVGPAPSGRGRVIVLGANVIYEGDRKNIPANAIVYQLEQFGSRWITETYLHLLRTHLVWDFSSLNVAKLKQLGCPRVQLCRIGAVPSEGRGKDIDVCFYGSPNDRRKSVLAELRAKGFVIHDSGAWGSERLEILSRSKILLNVHYYPDAVLEMVRLAPAIEHRAFIVSEKGADPELEKPFEGGIVFAPYDQLVMTVADWLARSVIDRSLVAERGHAALLALPHQDEVARALKESIPDLHPRRIKCYINNRNRLTWTKAIAREIERLDGEPIIVDNASTYPPLLSWYTECPYRVVRLNENAGARAPWISGTLERELLHNELYVVTDPDLDLSKVPDDALAVLRRGLERHGTRKAGLSLEISDVPDVLLRAVQVNRLTLQEIESGYWQKRLDAEFFSAATDTTFAMYRHDSERSGASLMDAHFYNAVRADRPYTARHLPWYRTEKDFDEEDHYYVAHRQITAVNGTWYDSLKNVAP